MRTEHTKYRNIYLQTLVDKILPKNLLDIVNTFPLQPEFKNPSYSITYDPSTEWDRNWVDINIMVGKKCHNELGVHCEFKPIIGPHGKYEFKVSLYN